MGYRNSAQGTCDDLIWYAYPNVVEQDDRFIGLGWYVAARPGDPLLAAGYALADPNIIHKDRLAGAVALLAPASYHAAAQVYEYKEDPKIGLGNSLGLAYLLAQITRSRKIGREFLGQTLWCTGAIDLHRGAPELKAVFPNQFDVKFRAFLADPAATLFLLPFANLTPRHRQECQAQGVRLVTFAEFCALPAAEHFRRKTILQLQCYELEPLIEWLFPKTVRLHNPREFTVKIRRPADQAVVGTGIAVSRAGQIVTCTHVIEAALGVHLCEASPQAEVLVYFPYAASGEVKTRRAQIAAYRAEYRDDLVLLQVVGGDLPCEASQLPVFGDARASRQNPFRTYGYQAGPGGVARYAQGTLGDTIEPPEGASVGEEPLQLTFEQPQRDLSGAAVIDAKRNLVVGIISSFGLAAAESASGWALNARILSQPPFNLPLGARPEEPAAAAIAPYLAQTRADATAEGQFAWSHAPGLLREWVGRTVLLEQLRDDWLHVERKMTGLIGFGGEGKSSLARKFAEGLRHGLWPDTPTPHAVFGWSFYSSPNADQFFEALFRFLTAATLNPQDYAAPQLKAQVIMGYLHGGRRYLLLLDGLEVMQEHGEDGYGLLRNADLRDFLMALLTPGNRSFCVLTSRLPVVDLIPYTTYTHRELASLTAVEGQTLLRELGVGPDAYDESALRHILQAWGSHALTLSLVAKYIVQHQALPAAITTGTIYERVSRILKHYDADLTAAERAFLMIFSLFRRPVAESAFAAVFRTVDPAAGEALQTPLAALTAVEFGNLLQRLETYAILRHDGQYSIHPLIREYFRARLQAEHPAHVPALQRRLKAYYLTLAEQQPEPANLEALAPVLEAVHYACQAGEYDEAYEIMVARVNQGQRYVLTDEWGAWDTYLSLLQEFFAEPEAAGLPQVSAPKTQGTILHESGYALMMLGRLREAIAFYQKSLALEVAAEHWREASITYQTLAEVYAHLGELDARADADRESQRLARLAALPEEVRNTLADHAWAEHLRGQLQAASETFRQVAQLTQELPESKKPQVYSLHVIRHAEHLRRTGQLEQARQVITANLAACQREPWPDYESLSLRVLADLEAAAGHQDSARTYYDQALNIIRRVNRTDILIDVLLARGRWRARAQQEAMGAFADLREALDYAVKKGYRLYEIDLRIGLAWAYLAKAKAANALEDRAAELRYARAQAAQAEALSAARGYYWGKLDAAEVNIAIDQIGLA